MQLGVDLAVAVFDGLQQMESLEQFSEVSDVKRCIEFGLRLCLRSGIPRTVGKELGVAAVEFEIFQCPNIFGTESVVLRNQVQATEPVGAILEIVNVEFDRR